MLKEHPQYTGLVTIKPDGSLFCDSLRTGRTLNLANRRYFQEALRPGNPLAVEPVFRQLTGRAVLQIAYGVRRADGEPDYVLLASLDLDKYMQSYAKFLLRDTVVIALMDSRGTVLDLAPRGREAARHLARELAVGRIRPPAQWRCHSRNRRGRW